MKKITIILFISNILCCNNFNQIIISNLDLTPPFIEELKVINDNTIKIASNEKVTFISSSFISRENMSVKSITYSETEAIIEFNSTFISGKEYSSEFRIEDLNGNSIDFIGRYYGYNENIPEIIINEFTAKGSNTNPNKIELYVRKSGNMAGVTIYIGTKSNFDYNFIFPSMDVNEGEYIVIRTITDNYSIPYIETTDLSVNNDKKFIDGVRDLRIDDFKLSSTNGTITLYNNPFGEIMDAVIYSKNFNDDSKNNRNFGLNKMVLRVDEIAEENQWVGLYDVIFPNDVIYIGDSTSTRSLCRLNFLDNNKNSNWITVGSSAYTFGYVNSTISY